MSLLSQSVDTFYAFRFLRLLTTPWENTGAFKAGIIDEKGKVLKQPSTRDERAVYNLFHKLVFNIKRLLNKIPFGKTTIASYLTALYLIKEETGATDEQLLESFSQITSEKLEFEINESSINEVLLAGIYTIKHDLLLPKTGDCLCLEGSKVIAESDSIPVGNIFGFPQYEVFHIDTNKKILVNIQDLEI